MPGVARLVNLRDGMLKKVKNQESRNQMSKQAKKTITTTKNKNKNNNNKNNNNNNNNKIKN